MKPRILPAVLVLAALLMAAPAAQATRTAPSLGVLEAGQLPASLLSRPALDAAAAPELPLLSPKDRAIAAALASLDEPDRARLLALRRLRLTGPAASLSRPEPPVWGQKAASRRIFWSEAPNLWEIRLLNPALRQGGLFLELDPLGPVDSPNLYQAFGFDGLNVRDPFGECVLTGDDVPCLDYAWEIAWTFSPSPKASMARLKATGRFLKHEAIGVGKFSVGAVKAGINAVKHPIQSLKAAGDALSRPSEALRTFLENPVETVEELPANAQRFAYRLSNADPDEAGEYVGGTLAGVVAFEAGGRALSTMKGALGRSGLPATGVEVGRATGLSDNILRLTEQHLTNSGDTVLGRFPGYIEKANARNASYFDIGKPAWDALGDDTLRWEANRHFLDIVSSRGDRILLSIPKRKIEADTWLAREVLYLTKQRGYQWVNQWSLRPGG